MCDSVYNCAFLTWQLSLFVFKLCRCYFIMMPMRKVVKINNLNIALKKKWLICNLFFLNSRKRNFVSCLGDSQSNKKIAPVNQELFYRQFLMTKTIKCVSTKWQHWNQFIFKIRFYQAWVVFPAELWNILFIRLMDFSRSYWKPDMKNCQSGKQMTRRSSSRSG